MTSNELILYRKLFDHMIDIVLVIAGNGQLLYGNQSALDFYGLSADELQKHTIYEFRKANEKQLVKKQLLLAATQGIEFETYHLRKNGEYTPVKVRSVSCEGCADGTIVSIVQDTTKMTNFSNKSKMFDVSLDIAKEAIIAFDSDLCITIWNKAAKERFGYEASEMIGKKIGIITPEDEKSKMKMLIKLLQMGQTIEQIVTTRIHKNGSLIDVIVSYSPVFDQHQHTIGYVGVYCDVSEFKKLCLKLEEYQKKASLALQGEKFCIWDINLKDKSIEIHNNMNKLIGKRNEGLSNDYRSWLENVHPEDREKVMEITMQQIKQKKGFVVEYRSMLEPDTYKWILTKGKVIEYENENTPIRILGTTEDITERKEYEDLLIEKNKKLEKLIKETEIANNAKSQFLANMSHEIRTPLNGIISATQLLKKTDGFSEEQKKLMDILDFSALSLKEIVTDILDISKAEQEKIEINNSVFSLKILMQSIFNELQLNANMKGIEAGYLFDPRISYDVIGDEQKIKQILNNLITNAIKFTEVGYISLKTKILEESTEKIKVEFEIKDTGIGICQEDIDRIFEAFTQVDSSTGKKYSGTGLGLTICNQFAEVLGGEILCRSEKGIGSSFSFVCPLSKAEHKEILKNESNVSLLNLNNSVENLVSEKTVMSVDDNPMNQRVVEIIVTRMGYRYLAAYDGEEAFKFLESENVNLILMDIQLPGTNGYQLTEKIKKMEKYRKIPIIAMTAYSQIEDKEKCFDAGMLDFIVKPIDIDYMENTLKKFML